MWCGDSPRSRFEHQKSGRMGLRNVPMKDTSFRRARLLYHTHKQKSTPLGKIFQNFTGSGQQAVLFAVSRGGVSLPPPGVPSLPPPQAGWGSALGNYSGWVACYAASPRAPHPYKMCLLYGGVIGWRLRRLLCRLTKHAFCIIARLTSCAKCQVP